MTAAAKLTAVLLTDERSRQALGWIAAAVLSPLILAVALLCVAGAGGEEHNRAAISASFYGTSYTEQVPLEFQEHVAEMQTAFSRLDSEITSVNNYADGSLDAVRVKAAFFALCFGEDAPSSREAARFVSCFYRTETRTRDVEVTDEETGEIRTEEEEYSVNVPVALDTAYENLAALLEREVTDADRTNAERIYGMICGTTENGSIHGSYQRGRNPSAALDVSVLTNPDTKNAADLVAYAEHAWESGWGYVWGCFGQVLTDSLLEYKISQYPEGVGQYENIIREKWMGGRVTDCVGLIKGYGWLDPDTLTIRYGTNGMPDVSANQMYYAATESGPISTIPEIPGLAVWKAGHIGIYIGSGYVIEASGTSTGVIKTRLAQRSFTHWLKIPYIQYD